MEKRFIVRKRGDGYAVWDNRLRFWASEPFATRATAAKYAAVDENAARRAERTGRGAAVATPKP